MENNSTAYSPLEFDDSSNCAPPSRAQYAVKVPAQRANMRRRAKNAVAETYTHMTYITIARWVSAFVIIPLASVLLENGPCTVLTIACYYSIGAAIVQLPLLGFPKIRPRSSTDASPPTWVWLILIFTAIVWIPGLYLLFQGYTDQKNLPPNPLYAEYPSYDPSIKENKYMASLGLGVAIVAMVQLLLGAVTLAHLIHLHSSAWKPEDIETFFHKTKKRNPGVQVAAV